ncbi:MAG: hypothetical protein ACLRMG_08465 [Clostridium sp.]
MKILKLLMTFILCITLVGCQTTTNQNSGENTNISQNSNIDDNRDKGITLDNLPEYPGEPFVALYNNVPDFDNEIDKAKKSFETYSDLDSLGRCGVAYANIGKDLMPTDKRGNISSVKPVQPGIKIDYKTGDSELNQDDNTTSQTPQNSKNTETN